MPCLTSTCSSRRSFFILCVKLWPAVIWGQIQISKYEKPTAPGAVFYYFLNAGLEVRKKKWLTVQVMNLYVKKVLSQLYHCNLPDDLASDDSSKAQATNPLQHSTSKSLSVKISAFSQTATVWHSISSPWKCYRTNFWSACRTEINP